MALHDVIHLPTEAVVVAFFDAANRLARYEFQGDAATSLECCWLVFDDLHGFIPFNISARQSFQPAAYAGFSSFGLRASGTAGAGGVV
jgi:hypothetical protein